VHASWLKQVEIFFSIVQRKVVSPSDFTDLEQVQDRLTAFEQRYNATAQPFKWKFTPTDLKDLLARIERHEQKERTQQHEHHHQPAALAHLGHRHLAAKHRHLPQFRLLLRLLRSTHEPCTGVLSPGSPWVGESSGDE
jgi:hypothetical protein